MGHASPYGFITLPDGTDAVSRAAYNSALTEIDTGLHTIEAAVDAHIGAGGTSEHPAATTSVAGFLSAADKTKLDSLVMGGWLVDCKYGVNLTSLTNWDGSAVQTVRIARIPSLKGELAYWSMFSGQGATHLFSQRISVTQAVNLTIPLLANDDLINVYFKKQFGDGAVIDGGGYASLGYGYRNLAVSLTETGIYTVYVLLNNASGTESKVAMGEWYPAAGLAWSAWE